MLKRMSSKKERPDELEVRGASDHVHQSGSSSINAKRKVEKAKTKYDE